MATWETEEKLFLGENEISDSRKDRIFIGQLIKDGKSVDKGDCFIKQSWYTTRSDPDTWKAGKTNRIELEGLQNSLDMLEAGVNLVELIEKKLGKSSNAKKTLKTAAKTGRKRKSKS